ncbi:interleukin-17F-like [Lithobates pipiens]
MAITNSALICVVVLVSVCYSAFLPEGYLSHASPHEEPKDDHFPLESTKRCAGRKNWHLRTSMTLDASIIDTDYMDSVLEVTDINRRSLSPWEFRLNTDADRFPLEISEADCFTFACIDSEGNEDPDLISYPIQQEMIVLRRQQRDCDYIYSLEMELITVGCTCVRSSYSYYY